MKTVHERTDVFKNSPAPFIQHYLGTIFYSTSFGTVCCITLSPSVLAWYSLKLFGYLLLDACIWRHSFFEWLKFSCCLYGVRAMQDPDSCLTSHILTRAPLFIITLQRAVNSWNKTPKKFIASRAHGVLTNVPGPQVPIMYVNDTRVGSEEIFGDDCRRRPWCRCRLTELLIFRSLYLVASILLFPYAMI